MHSGAVPGAAMRTSSSSELFSESLSDGMPSILCMFAWRCAARSRVILGDDSAGNWHRCNEVCARGVRQNRRKAV